MGFGGAPKQSAASKQLEALQLQQQKRAERDRISLLSNQLGQDTMSRARRFGRRSLMGPSVDAPSGTASSSTGLSALSPKAQDFITSKPMGLLGFMVQQALKKEFGV